MNIDYTISKLKEQKQKVHQGDTEVWLKTTYSFLEEYFKSYSSRAQSFQGVINDFSRQKIWGLTSDHIKNFKGKAIEYIDETIQYLEDQRIHQQNEAIQKANALKQIEERMKNIQKTEHSSSGAKILPVAPPTGPIIKTQLPFGISGGLFWAIITGFISAAFILGLYFGSNKFDRNLIELSDTNRELKDTIKVRENTIKYIRNNSDSALNILGHMPYNEMTLDTLSFRKVQTTIENAGGALYLNK